MKKENSLKYFSLFVAALVVLNLVLFSFRVIGAGIFWVVILLCAIFAFIIQPRLKGGKK